MTNRERRALALQQKRLRDDILGAIGCVAVCVAGVTLIAVLA